MRLVFLGAAGTLARSKYLVDAGSRRLLVDCGLFQGIKQLRLLNSEKLTVDPGTINLMHAHLDHGPGKPLCVLPL
jgi:metallo-beta-lactamase family protein